MKINAFSRLVASPSEGRFNNGKDYDYVIKELTRGLGKPSSIAGFRRADTLEVRYMDHSVVLTSKNAIAMLTKLGRDKYEVVLSKATNGVTVTVLDTLA